MSGERGPVRDPLLLAPDKIEVPVAMPAASPVLADDAEGEDRWSGWPTDGYADALDALAGSSACRWAV